MSQRLNTIFPKRIFILQKNNFLFRTSFFICLFVFGLTFFTTTNFVFAQTSNLAINSDERAALELELKQLEEESLKIQKELEGKKGQRKSLENELSLINSKINESKNKIKKTQTTIKKLSGDIQTKEKKIQTLAERIDKSRTAISESLRQIRKLDDVRAVIAFSKDENFSEVFRDFGDYRSLQGSLAESVDGLKTNKKFVEVEKEELEEKKDETEALRKKQEQEKREEEERSKEKKEVIAVTKMQEKDYEKVLAEKKKKVEQIKNRLFALRDSGSLTFDLAQKYAREAGRATGVRPALILGILKQESDLGKNDGRCYVTNFDTGDGVHSKTGAIMRKTMHPTRDIPAFLEITKSLGIDPAKRLVSCPLSYGYGGAMGPTQFIPSTWKQYAPQVAAINGGVANPWDGKDAITATALYLAKSGATSQNYTAERNAACRYYSGRICSQGVGAPGYGNSVMAHAANFQKDIDLIND